MKRFYQRTITTALSVAAAVALLTSCGKKDAGNAQDIEIAEIENIVAENVKDREHNASHVDSLAFMADDLTPSEATQVLATYMQIAADAKERGDRKIRLETMRKYVDVYDIVISANGSEMRDMFERLRRHSPEFDIPQTAADFRAELSDYADGSADDGLPQETTPDTVATKIDTISAPAAEPTVEEFTVE